MHDKLALNFLTLYAFSSENWNRPEQEVSALMTLFMQALDREVKKLHKNNIRLKIIGDVSRFSEKLQEKIAKAENLTENNTALNFKYCGELRWLLGYCSSDPTIS